MSVVIPSAFPEFNLEDFGSGAAIGDEPLNDLIEAQNWVWVHSGHTVACQVFDPDWQTTSTSYTRSTASSADYAEDIIGPFTVLPLRDVRSGSSARIAFGFSAALNNCDLRARVYAHGGTLRGTATLSQGAGWGYQSGYVLVDPALIQYDGRDDAYIVIDAKVPTTGTARIAHYAAVSGIVAATNIPRGY